MVCLSKTCYPANFMLEALYNLPPVHGKANENTPFKFVLVIIKGFPGISIDHTGMGRGEGGQEPAGNKYSAVE